MVSAAFTYGHNQQRRPLTSLLSLSFFYGCNQPPTNGDVVAYWLRRVRCSVKAYDRIRQAAQCPGSKLGTLYPHAKTNKKYKNLENVIIFLFFYLFQLSDEDQYQNFYSTYIKKLLII